MQDGLLINTILVVEDVPELLTLIAQTLRQSGYEVFEARSPAEGIFICEHTEVDLILSDFNMPGMNGIEFAEKVETLHLNCSMIFMSGNPEACDELTALGFLCLRKPFSFADMEYTVRKTLDAQKSASA